MNYYMVDRFVVPAMGSTNAFQGAGFKFSASKANEKPLVVGGNGEVKENQTERFKILIAEDDVTSECLLKIMVKPLCNDVIIVRNGVEAVEACQLNRDIDLILMDIKMPNINGYEATRQIRQFNKSVVIIAQTAYALAGDREKAIEAGCNDHITKPIAKNVLIEMIRGYLKVKG